MKISCKHGFFLFEETQAGQISDFMRVFGFSIVPFKDKYTFEALSTAEKFSIEGKSYLGLNASQTMEGEISDVFEANGWVFDFVQNKTVLISSVTNIFKIFTSDNFYFSEGLILPGSLTDEGLRVKDYSAWFSLKTMSFKYSEVSYVEDT